MGRSRSLFLDKRHGLQELDRSHSSDDCTAAATVDTLMNGFSAVCKSLLDVLNLIAEQRSTQVTIQIDGTEI